MSDPLAASRLPDLPDAGYSTRTERALSDAMMLLIRGLERDRLLLLEIVIQGRTVWRKRFCKEFRSIKADTDFADAVFGYLVLLAGPNPPAQKAILETGRQHEATQRWDRRLSTVLKQAKERRALTDDIRREATQPRKVYG